MNRIGPSTRYKCLVYFCKQNNSGVPNVAEENKYDEYEVEIAKKENEYDEYDIEINTENEYNEYDVEINKKQSSDADTLSAGPDKYKVYNTAYKLVYNTVY